MTTPENHLDAQDMMAQAQTEIGLTDWGGDDFREGLDALLHFCQEQAGLSQRGQQHLVNACVHHLSNRLRIEDLVTRHPEILEEKVLQPMFLVTFPRSGSTLLHRLLSQDPGIRAPLYGEMWQPAPQVSQEVGKSEREIRMKQADEFFWEPLDAMFPEGSPARASIPCAFDAGECYVLFENSFTCFNYTFDYHIPGYLDWLSQLDFRPVYAYFKKQLQVLQWQAPGQPWCMKSADHLLGIEGLLSIFPDANLVALHRDPMEMVPSLGNLQGCYLDLWREQPMDPKVLGHYCLERYRRIASQAATLQDRVDPRQYYAMDYKQLTANPVEEVKHLMEYFDYPMHPQFATRLEHWLDANPKPKNRYSLDTYGLGKSEVTESLATYVYNLRPVDNTPV
ncbi:TPA: sulfotransferase [Candidatus Poribacteria bacterium]|nr:sulfotransferase [Candidatus Poribacteria bacterium]